jgi:hypothetical protein
VQFLRHYNRSRYLVLAKGPAVATPHTASRFYTYRVTRAGPSRVTIVLGTLLAGTPKQQGNFSSLCDEAHM